MAATAGIKEEAPGKGSRGFTLSGRCGGRQVTVGKTWEHKTPHQKFEPHQGDCCDGEVREPDLGPMRIRQERRAKLRTDQSTQKRDNGDCNACESHLGGGNLIARRVLLKGRGAQPMHEPDADSNAANDGAAVLKKLVVMHWTEAGDRQLLFEEGEMAIRPVAVVGKRVPQHVRCLADENRNQHEAKLKGFA